MFFCIGEEEELEPSDWGLTRLKRSRSIGEDGKKLVFGGEDEKMFEDGVLHCCDVGFAASFVVAIVSSYR